MLGVDASKTAAAIANRDGIETLNEYFDLDLVSRLGRRFDVINAAGVFFHLEELHSVTDGIREALARERREAAGAGAAPKAAPVP